MKLYDWQIAPNPRRVRMFLAEKDIAMPTEQVGATDQVDLFDWFLAISPRRRVPLLALNDVGCSGLARLTRSSMRGRAFGCRRRPYFQVPSERIRFKPCRLRWLLTRFYGGVYQSTQTTSLDRL